MTERIHHKRGDVFSAACVAWLDEALTTPRDLTNVTVTCSMKAPLRDPYAFQVTFDGDRTLGEFTLRAPSADTSNWRPTTWLADIQYATAGEPTSTETFQVQVLEDYTIGN